MKRNLILAAILSAGAAFGGPVGYVLNFSGQFGVMDLLTGSFSPIGAGSSANAAGGLGGAPGGPFYATDGTTGHLLRISPGGAITDVGDTGTGASTGPNGISVLGGLTNGLIYVLDYSNRLFQVNTTTGALSLRGTLALPAQEQQYDGNMVTSFNGDGSLLYYTLDIATGPRATGPALYRINPATLAITSTAITGLGSRIIGSGFVGGTFYTFTDFGEIYTLNLASGAASLFGHYDSGSTFDNPGPPFTGVFGVVGTPEPGTWLLSACGIAALCGARRRSI